MSKRNRKAAAAAAQPETIPQAATEAEVVQHLEAGADQVRAAETPTVGEFVAAVEAAPTTEVKKPAEKKPAMKPLKPGMMVSLKELVFADPNLGVDELLEQLKAKGFTPSKSSVLTIRADFLHSLRVVHFLGLKGLSKFVAKE